ncbi:RnfH family protein [Legionella sp. CNM-1927-20]|uniref:RnfH family protein n=1 Tax=Legionella sp. CNM-1927-20 TaxID=3422221 RepID=UPI00403B373C
MVEVEVIYIDSEQVITHLYCKLPEGATVEDALKESAIFTLCPEIDELPIGIFSKRVERTTPLRTGDRIEIYRPLLTDPKEKRRLRAKKN